jgi:hypothetical protein
MLPKALAVPARHGSSTFRRRNKEFVTIAYGEKTTLRPPIRGRSEAGTRVSAIRRVNEHVLAVGFCKAFSAVDSEACRMDLPIVIKVLNEIWMADIESYWIVGGLTVVIAAVMRAMLPMKGLALVFAPAIFFGGLAGIYAAREMALAIVPDRIANLIATATFGMIVALVVMVLAFRCVDAAIRIRRPLTNTPDRARMPART